MLHLNGHDGRAGGGKGGGASRKRRRKAEIHRYTAVDCGVPADVKWGGRARGGGGGDDGRARVEWGEDSSTLLHFVK